MRSLIGLPVLRGVRVVQVAGVSAALPLLVAGMLTSACGDDRTHHTRLVLLLTVDTLRVDRLGAYGSELDLTPNLDALARESEVFANAFAPAPFTLPSLVSIHTGLYPEQAGVHSNNTPLPSDVQTLAQLLQAAGWRTAAVVGNYVVRERSGLAAGFDHYDARFPQLEASRRLPERAATATTDHAIEALDRLLAGSPKQVFLWVHYQDPHGPYLPPGDLRQRYLAHEAALPDGGRVLEIAAAGLGGLPRYQVVEPLPQQESASHKTRGAHTVADYRAGYDGEVRYVDTQLGRLLDAIETRGLGDRATIVFAADHGESLGEGDYWFAHGEYLNEAVLRVPLMLRVPGRSPGRRTDLVGLIDLLPTLVQHLAVAAPGGEPRPGRDLLADPSAHGSRTLLVSNLGVAEIPRHGVITSDYRLVVEAAAAGRPARVRAHRLGRGSESEKPLPASGAGATPTAELSTSLRQLRKAFPSRKPLPAGLSSEETDHLQALGYLRP